MKLKCKNCNTEHNVKLNQIYNEDKNCYINELNKNENENDMFSYKCPKCGQHIIFMIEFILEYKLKYLYNRG
jgi:hypothetical protein